MKPTTESFRLNWIETYILHIVPTLVFYVLEGNLNMKYFLFRMTKIGKISKIENWKEKSRKSGIFPDTYACFPWTKRHVTLRKSLRKHLLIKLKNCFFQKKNVSPHQYRLETRNTNKAVFRLASGGKHVNKLIKLFSSDGTFLFSSSKKESKRPENMGITAGNAFKVLYTNIFKKSLFSE